jgi:hypothetical protein
VAADLPAKRALLQTLARVGEAVAPIDDVTFFRTTSPTQPPISFHVWHVARWMDYYRDVLTGPDVQIWDREGVAGQWGFEPAQLGTDSTGMGMGDEASSAINWPSRAAVMAYFDQSIEALRMTLEPLELPELEQHYAGHLADAWRQQGIGTVTVGATLIAHLTHANRHLGMIEALKGAMELHGSATV